jgi:hypothetical protein
MKNDVLYYFAAAVLCGAWLLAPGRTEAAKNRDLSINLSGNADRCSDLRVTSDGQVAQANEAFTLTKAEAPALELGGIERGIFRVRGWDQPNYSVEVCKIAVADDRPAADQILRGISVTRSAGRFSATGPSNSDTWQVYFIVHAPKDSNVDLETKNAPIDIAKVSGTLKVRSQNGPVSLHDSSGTLEVHTTNGPISFGGGGGEVRLNAQNGPISLDLTGDMWNGSLLDARTVNGPVSISMADTFHSGVRLETSGHVPVLCAAGPCRSAWNDNESNPRVIQLNGSQDTIRVSTTNGPVTVHAPRKNRHII